MGKLGGGEEQIPRRSFRPTRNDKQVRPALNGKRVQPTGNDKRVQLARNEKHVQPTRNDKRAGAARSDVGSGKMREAGGRDNIKHKGTMAEMQFMLDAAKRGFGVARPFVDNERYDVIVDSAKRLWRVQVKLSGARHHAGFAVRSSWRTSSKHMPYTVERVDFLAVLLHGEQVGGKRIWYLIPVRALGGRLHINLYPFGCRRDGELRWERYRGGWWRLGTGL